MPLTKQEVGFIFFLVLICFFFYLAYRIHFYKKIRDQEDVYRKLWKKYYKKDFTNQESYHEDRKSKEKGR